MKKDMAAFFDALAQGWDNSPGEYDKREKLVSMMGLPTGSVIADIGCGRGVMFEHLLKTGPAKVIAIDLSGEMIRLARESFDDERIEYLHGDFLDAALPMLDAAVIFNSYPHFIDKEALAVRLGQAVRKNGIVMIAHSQGRAVINGRHKGGASKLSVPLESAADEGGKFEEFFAVDILVDDEDIYFVKMRRKD